VIWKDNRIQTNQASLVHPGNKVASSKIARNRNVNANSVSAKNKVANRAVGVANRAVAANKVARKADDKPGYLEKESGGRRLPPLFSFPTDQALSLCGVG
jgi:hypothetical protein